MSNNYNHNVDVKSSQLANAIKFIFKLIGFGSIGGLILFIISAIILINIDKKEKENELLARKRATLLDLPWLIDDYSKNQARYTSNWNSQQYFTYRNRIGNITTYSFSFAPEAVYYKGKRVDVKCTYSSDQDRIVAQYNPGDMVTVTGKSDGFTSMNPNPIFSLTNCIISN